MKIFIVAPLYKPIGRFYELPIGLGYISSKLKSTGHDVTFCNMNEELLIHSNNNDFDNYFDRLCKSNEVLLVGGLSVHYQKIKDIIARAKGFNPHLIAVVGGGIFSSEPELMMQNLGCDFGIIGEGEEAIVKLLNNMSTSEKIIKADSISDLDSLEFPDFEGMKVDNYLSRQVTGDEYYMYPIDNPRCLPIISSRSCPFNCTFCFHPTGKVYRQRSIENFEAEVKYLVEKYNINILTILDELISANKERLSGICKIMKKYKLNWLCQMRVSNVTREMLQEMKDSGCFVISYGIEHIDDNVLKSMEKHTSEKEITNALKLTYEVGIGIQGNILFGDLAETPESIIKALDWWKTNIKYAINLGIVIPYCGTKLYEYYVKNGLNKLEFIKNGCPPQHKHLLNTSLPDQYRQQFNHLPHKLLKKQQGKIDPIKKQLYSVDFECFHCHKINHYDNLYSESTGSGFTSEYRIACRHCNQRGDFQL